ncbi:hypothetical protein D9758_000295 [Tetrapyrgos nigripes]|uniref:Uncharacterized protein n=1 Tax=Tetrapyrgos nigripes TaxID=182062 RepID=A0A8H5H0T7_9AGAR|nr:hypothetical protein D9758_000295 [Tetrapyrgos nigripes]
MVVKQELFMTDISNCVSSLKKVVQEFQSGAVMEATLQLPQPVLKAAAVTIAADPNAAYMMDFDALVATASANPPGPNQIQAEAQDDDFNPEKPAKRQNKPTSKRSTNAALTEDVRADMCTLKEHHDHLLSNSFDLSFQGSAGGLDASSSQPDPGFQPIDNFFTLNDLDMDIGLGDELARELGEGWGASPVRNAMEPQQIEDGNAEMDVDLNFMLDASVPMDTAEDNAFFNDAFFAEQPDVLMDQLKTPLKQKAPTSSAGRKENRTPGSRARSVDPTAQVLSPTTSFSRLFLSQVDELAPASPLHDITAHPNLKTNKKPPSKKQKRTRLLLDPRTELTDEELKLARAQYLQGQHELRRDLDTKRLEKDSGQLLEDMIWGVPSGINAPILVDFWQENFKVQVEARTGVVRLHMPDDEPPSKRRKIQKQVVYEELETARSVQEEAPVDDMPEPMAEDHFGLGLDFGVAFGDDFGGGANPEPEPSHNLRSSEEPGQGRRDSRQLSIGRDFDFGPSSNDLNAGSQRSSLFPWDNAGAGPSSSVDFGPDRVSVDRAETRIRSSPKVNSRRESSVGFSQIGSIGRGLSPADLGTRGSQVFGDDFIFDGVDDTQGNTLETQQTQRTEADLAALEKNSFNFLE